MNRAAQRLDTLFLLREDTDLGRRRLQQKGDLYNQGGWWKLRWREDDNREAELSKFFTVLSKVQTYSRTPSGEAYDAELKGFHVGSLHKAGCHYLKKGGADSRVIEANFDMELILPKCGKCFPEQERSGPRVTVTFDLGSSPPRQPAASERPAPQQAKQIGSRFMLGPASEK